jgi:uncharacterized protein (TIGR03435 family)
MHSFLSKFCLVRLATITLPVTEIVLALFAMPLAGQQPQSASAPPASSAPGFIVASVKPVQASDQRGSKTDFSMGANGDGVKLTIMNATLLDCIERAYGVREYQVSGPKWIASERYDIIATAPRVGTKQIWKMLQTLLTDRFQITLHHDSKVFPVYELVVAKGGPKLHEAKPDGPSGVRGERDKLTANRTSMTQLAQVLSGQMDRPVVDSTGLAGVFDFTLEYTRQERLPDNQDAGGTGGNPLPAPPLPEALKEQLGLDLKSGKAPLDVLVIDSANKMPTAN